MPFMNSKAETLASLLRSDTTKGNGKNFFPILPTIVTSELYVAGLTFACSAFMEPPWNQNVCLIYNIYIYI